MSSPVTGQDAAGASSPSLPLSDRVPRSRVILASLVGTTIEF